MASLGVCYREQVDITPPRSLLPTDTGLSAVAWLDHQLLGWGDGAALSTDGEQAVTTALAGAQGPLRGLSINALDPDMVAALRHAGAPLTAVDSGITAALIRIDTSAQAPNMVGDQLVLPAADTLRRCNGVALKPLRMWFAQHLNLRLQAAPGVAWYLWSNQAILVSTHDERLAGFLHGPDPAQRHSLMWEPHGIQRVRW